MFFPTFIRAPPPPPQEGHQPSLDNLVSTLSHLKQVDSLLEQK
jgi:hypothetical protein